MSDITSLLRQKIHASWRDHDGGTPEDASRHYAENALLRPLFDDQQRIHGKERIRSWFEHQRQKFDENTRWNFQHRVMSATVDPHQNEFRCQVYLLTTGQKRNEDGEVRSFWVPGISLERWVKKSEEWQILERSIEVSFAAYGQPEALAPLQYSSRMRHENIKTETDFKSNEEEENMKKDHPVEVSEIEKLLMEYCHRVDRGTAAEVADLFTEDATLVPEFDGDYEVQGQKEIQRFFQHYHDHFRSGVRHLQHMTTTPIIHVTENIASSNSYLLATFVDAASGTGMMVTGSYTDALKNEHGKWKFLRRTIQVHFLTSHAETIEKLEPMGFEN
ncbi:nuclear transport factor 2 family protein [Planctomycetota bacterium]|nr:nuclear transport factor 2 family protein [Planctomycetota bacterium]